MALALLKTGGLHTYSHDLFQLCGDDFREKRGSFIVSMKK